MVVGAENGWIWCQFEIVDQIGFKRVDGTRPRLVTVSSARPMYIRNPSRSISQLDAPEAVSDYLYR